MQVASMYFKERAHVKLHDAQLQRNLHKIKGKFVEKRRASLTELDDFEGTREAARAIRQRALDDLDVWLQMFERNATARGATVLWAETPDDVNRHVLAIAERHGAARIIKSKSMVSEEIELNPVLEGDGIEVVETDLGEYIVQLDNDKPSHIVAPILHKTKEDCARVFKEKLGATDEEVAGVPQMTQLARRVLRKAFLKADMGITGVNNLIAVAGGATPSREPVVLPVKLIVRGSTGRRTHSRSVSGLWDDQGLPLGSSGRRPRGWAVGDPSDEGLEGASIRSPTGRMDRA
jgi:L-lactate dehydrogenase complex protein LldF